MTTDFARAIPVLASLDIAETGAFYVDWLGFSVGYQDGNYLIVKREDMELHFWKTDDRKFPREHVLLHPRRSGRRTPRGVHRAQRDVLRRPTHLILRSAAPRVPRGKLHGATRFYLVQKGSGRLLKKPDPGKQTKQTK